MARALLYRPRVKVLVTSSRLPYAITEIRELGRAGHRVHAADTFRTAPGSHSRHVERSHVTASPVEHPVGYHVQIEEIVREHGIDLVLPAFEEVFYLARQGGFVGGAPIDAPPFETLAMLHNKAKFVQFAADIGLSVPETIVAHSLDELRDAVGEFDNYLARPAFSRAGSNLLSNTGELAGETKLEDCEPTTQNPWIVQRFVEGTDVCSFSVARMGRVTGHATYVHPRTLDHAGGVVFESIVEPDALAAAQRLAEATNYSGQLSLDFMRTADGQLHVIECNPRPTAGVCLMPEGMFVQALLDPPRSTLVAPAGTRRMFRGALIREMFLRPGSIPANVKEIFFSGTPDVVSVAGDRWPGFFQVLSFTHAIEYALDGGRGSEKLAYSYLHDVCWNGEPIPRRTLHPPRLGPGATLTAAGTGAAAMGMP
jgi:hypothetical protein